MDQASSASFSAPGGATAAAPGARPGQLTPITLEYTGEGSQLLGILFVNWLLTIVTLGFYYPWARVRELRFMIGSIRANADAFTFHGEGRELFWGVLRAWLLFGLPLVAIAIAMNVSARDTGPNPAWMLLFYALLLVFVPFALIGSLRYRASRTAWRGIRFGFDGRFSEFGPAYIVRLLGVIFSLGIAYPYVAEWRRRYVLEHSRIGSERFAYDGSATELFGTYLLCWFFALPSLGLTLTWFHGHQQAYFWNHTMLGGARFRSALTGGDWLMMAIVNGLLAAFTFGIAAPWIYVRIHRLFFSRLTLEGIDLARIHALASEGSGTGEGAASLLNVDAGLDIG